MDQQQFSYQIPDIQTFKVKEDFVCLLVLWDFVGFFPLGVIHQKLTFLALELICEENLEVSYFTLELLETV